MGDPGHRLVSQSHASLRLGGAFHSGIQVGPTEYAFGGHPNDDLGITALKKPLFVLRDEAQEAVRQGADADGTAAADLEWMPTLRSRTVIGWWMGPQSELEVMLWDLRFEERWHGSEYRLLSRNCNHFARALCAALLRHPLFKPAPGRSRPEEMVPCAVTRLPAVVLALGCCAPCIVRHLNAPIPLAPHALNAFQGQPRKANSESAARARALRQSREGGARARSRSASTLVNVRASAASVEGPSGVRQSSLSVLSSAGLRAGSSVGIVGEGGSGVTAGYSLGWPSGGPPPAATAAAAAAAAEGRLLRPRVEGRYQSLRVETARRSSADNHPLNIGRRRADDGGADSTADASTGCSTPDLAAVASAAAAAAVAAADVNGHRPASPQPEAASGSPFAMPSVAAAAGAAPPPPPPPPPPPAGVLSDPATSISASEFAATPSSAGPAPAPPTAMFSVSLPPPVVVMEAASAASSTTSAASATAVIAASAAAYGGGAHGAPSATTPQRPSGPRFLNSSRSGRRVFPDPRAASPGADGAGDAAAAPHDSVRTFSIDGSALPRGHPPDGPSPRDLSRGDLELGPLASAARAEGDAGPSPRRHAAAAGSGPGSCPGASPRTQGAAFPRGSRSQHQHPPQPHHTPRCSTSGALPPLPSSRLDGASASPAKPPLSPLPLSTPPSQVHHHHQHMQSQGSMSGSALLRSPGPTADGGGGAAAAAANQHSPSDAPRPWSVLSGGFVDLLFSPPATEPPPGVPHPVAVSGTRSGAGTGSGSVGVGVGVGVSHGGGIGRGYSSFTGDGGGLISGVSNATGGAAGGAGGLEPVASGDLSDELQDSPRRAAALRARASTGMLGNGEELPGGGGAGGGGANMFATMPPASSGLGAAAIAAASPLKPSGAASRGVVRTGPGPGPTPAPAPAGPAAVAAAVAADGGLAGLGAALPPGRREAF